MTGTVTEELEDLKMTTKDRLSVIKTEATRLRGDAADKARSAADEGKAKAAETLESVSRATREAAEKFRGGQAEPIARIVTSAADSVEDFAKRMQSKSVDDIVEDAREMVRRSPVIIIAVAAAAGFLLSRFFKSSSQDSDRDAGTGF